NGFIYYDGEFRMYGLRSGFQDGGQQQDDRTKWTIRATRDYRLEMFWGETDIAERLEHFRRIGVQDKGYTRRMFHDLHYFVDNHTRSFVESAATTSLDIRPFFDQQDSGQVVEGQSNSGVTRWDIEKGFDHSYLGFEGEHAFTVRKPKKASKGEPLSSQGLGKDPEYGYVEALKAADQLLNAAPDSAVGDGRISYYTPSGYQATIARTQHFMPSEAKWLVSLGKSEKVSQDSEV
ncbi:hypothetical protein B9479_008383, partial [Cryptococcus floricola]